MQISACSESTDSIDAKINGVYHGALTWALLKVFKPNISWYTLINDLNMLLKKAKIQQRSEIRSSKPINIVSDFIYL